MGELDALVERLEPFGFAVYSHFGTGPRDSGFGCYNATHNIKQEDNLIPSLETAIADLSGGYFGNMEEPFSVISYGKLRMPKTKIEDIPEVKPTQVRAQGMSGFFGGTRTEMKRIVAKGDVVNYEPVSLSQIVQRNQSAEPAYFVRITIPKVIQDERGRSTVWPHLTIVTDQACVKDLIEFLLASPGQYLDFVKAAVPASRFPQTNSFFFTGNKEIGAVWFLNVDQEGYPLKGRSSYARAGYHHNLFKIKEIKVP